MTGKIRYIVTGVFLAATLLFVLFIFGNSMQTGENSGALSKAVLEILHSMGIMVSELFIRKSAHFLEYFALGLLLAIDIRRITRNWWARIFAPLFCGLLIPVFDEAIQLLTPGRSGEVRDVLIDFTGVITGLVLMTLLIYLIIDRRKKKYPAA